MNRSGHARGRKNKKDREAKRLFDFMIVTKEEARQRFESIPKGLQNPYFHPEFIEIDAGRDKNLQPVYFVYCKNSFVYLHFCFKSEIPELQSYYDIQSPYGYGGPLTNTGDKNFLSSAWKEYCYWCKQNNVVVEFIRFHPLLKNWLAYKGELSYDRETVWIDLNEEKFIKYFRKNLRYDIKKAIKNDVKVRVLTDDYMSFFPEMYNSAMAHVKANSFYIWHLDFHSNLAQYDKKLMLEARIDDKIISAGIFLYSEDVMEYYLSASNEEGRLLGASKLILHEAARLARTWNIKELHLGGGKSQRQDDPLYKFKAGFSDKRAKFYIGKNVHIPKIYSHLKARFEDQFQKKAERILFYR